MVPKIHLKKNTYKVYKTGIPFYDATRLIGVAHLFFGTASAEIEDKGAYWEVKGIDVRREEEQIEWVIERERVKSHNFNQKISQIRNSLIEVSQKINNNQDICFDGLPTSRGGYAALVEFDAALSRGVRGIDPASNYLLLVSVSTQRNPKGKKYNIKAEDLATASIGFCFSAVARSSNCRTFILPVFKERIVLSGFLNYNKEFYHNAGLYVSNVYAAISILLDFASQKLPVTDFVYTSICGQNIVLKSGYLGLEKLCSLWWKAVEENNEERLRILRQIKLFLENTARQDTDSQNQALARYLAKFAANLDVDSLYMIERLKARGCYSIRERLKRENLSPEEKRQLRTFLHSLTNLFKSSKDIMEVKEMVGLELPDVPQEVSQALAKALELDEKGWMNQFTRLENATDFSQLIGYVEHIISRGYYRELQKEAQPNIRNTMNRARELASILKDLSENLANEKIFRAWKSIFLMDVLSRMKFGGGE